MSTHARGLYAMFGPGGDFDRADPHAVTRHCLALACVNTGPVFSLEGGASWVLAMRYAHASLPTMVRDPFGNPFRPARVLGDVPAGVVTLAGAI